MDFVKSAPIRGSRSRQPVKIVLLNQRIARFWHGHVQPLVKQASSVRARADEKWSWPWLLKYLPSVELLNGRRCFGYAVLADTAQGRSIPVALSLVVESFDLIQGESTGTFLWFAAVAPNATFSTFGVPRIDDLGRILVDTTMVTSFNVGQKGRISLHADDKGGHFVLRFYRTCGLIQVAQSQQLQGIRANDGRYFFANDVVASNSTRDMDLWR